LVKIDVQNQIVFLFDNDAEGYEAYRRLQKLALPANMRGMILPELDAFRAFPARGPEGVGTADINRRAAAIECTHRRWRIAGKVEIQVRRGPGRLGPCDREKSYPDFVVKRS
jgi:hypothetical protein